MKKIIVTNQKELDEIPSDFDGLIIIKGDVVLNKYYESSHVEARGSSHVVARESSHVVAWGSSHVEAWESSHVEAWESSHVEAWGSSHVEARGSSHVEAWESSHVVARESSHVVARGSSHVVAGKFVSIHKMQNHNGDLKGGKIIKVPMIDTIIKWCDFYGVGIKNEIIIMYKAVRDNFKSTHNFDYISGSIPVAPDWDGGEKECGGGLHFSPIPAMALQFDPQATKFLACPMNIKDIRIPKSDDQYPNKIKAHKCCAPIWEVDRYGKKIEKEL